MNEITTLEELKACVTSSEDKALFLLKHSTSCPISARAYTRVTDLLSERAADLPEFRMVKVLEARLVSNAITDSLSVEHQSPQLILVNGGKAVWSASHHHINGDNILKAVEKHATSVA